MTGQSLPPEVSSDRPELNACSALPIGDEARGVVSPRASVAMTRALSGVRTFGLDRDGWSDDL